MPAYQEPQYEPLMKALDLFESNNPSATSELLQMVDTYSHPQRGDDQKGNRKQKNDGQNRK